MDNLDGSADKGVDLISNTLPSIVYERSLDSLPIDMEYACIFSFIEYDRRRNDIYRNSKYLSFNKFLWPMIIIQVGLENYIFIDNISFFSLQYKIHEFENIELLTNVNEMIFDDYEEIQRNITIIKNFLSNISVKNKKINGLIEPEILKGISPLIKLGSPDFSLNSIKFQYDETQLEPTEISNQYATSLKKINRNVENIENILKYLNESKDTILELLSRKQSKNVNNVIFDTNKLMNSLELNDINDNIKFCLNAYNELYNVLKSEMNYLNRWSVAGSVIGVILPIIRIWFPLYIAEIITDSGDTRWIVAPPLIFQPKTEREIPLDVFHPSFLTSLKDRVESNFKYLQNFISNDKGINFFSIKEVNRFISEGFTKLYSDSLMNNKLLNHIQKVWNKNVKI